MKSSAELLWIMNKLSDELAGGRVLSSIKQSWMRELLYLLWCHSPLCVQNCQLKLWVYLFLVSAFARITPVMVCWALSTLTKMLVTYWWTATECDEKKTLSNVQLTTVYWNCWFMKQMCPPICFSSCFGSSDLYLTVSMCLIALQYSAGF